MDEQINEESASEQVISDLAGIYQYLFGAGAMKGNPAIHKAICHIRAQAEEIEQLKARVDPLMVVPEIFADGRENFRELQIAHNALVVSVDERIANQNQFIANLVDMLHALENSVQALRNELIGGR